MPKITLQERPKWCRFEDCLFLRRVSDYICGGKLPKPEPHQGDFNTHRFCLKFHKDDPGPKGIFSLKVNESDLDWFRWIFDALDGKKTSSLSHA